MATFSTVMGLKLNVSTDAFALGDFTANWNLLDASPGIFICTSTTRPAWGANQAGRHIFMTDTKQSSYWDGSNWNDPRNSSPVFAGSSYINTPVAHGTDGDFSVLTFTTPRPSSVLAFLSGTYACANNQTQDVQQSLHFDGAAQTMGFVEQMRFAGNSADAANTATQSATSLAIIATVAPGQHQIGLHVHVSGTYKTGITVIGGKAFAIVSLFSSGNTL